MRITSENTFSNSRQKVGFETEKYIMLEKDHKIKISIEMQKKKPCVSDLQFNIETVITQPTIDP